MSFKDTTNSPLLPLDYEITITAYQTLNMGKTFLLMFTLIFSSLNLILFPLVILPL